MAIKAKPMTKARAPKKITINDLAVMVQNGFNSIHSEMDTRFNGIDARFDQLESQVKNIETRIEGLDTRFDALQGVVVNEHGNRLNAVESDVLKIKITLQNK